MSAEGISLERLIALATEVRAPTELTHAGSSAGTVGAAVLTSSGTVHRGVCIHTPCGTGFCAEVAALAAAVTAGETMILAVAAVAEDGVIPPCGRCREFMLQLHLRNGDATVALRGGRSMRLRELMPEHRGAEG